MNRLALALVALFAFGASAGAQEVKIPVPNAGAYGAYNSSPPTCVNGSGCWLQVDVNGNLKTTSSGGGGGGLSVVDSAAWTAGVSPFTPTGGVFNDSATNLTSGQQGTVRLTNDRQVKMLDSAVLAAVQAPIPLPTASGNATTGVTCGSAVSSCVLKASAGNLMSVYANCTAACWLMVFNSTTAPSNGATTAGQASGDLVHCIDISAGSSKSLSFATFPGTFSVGMTAAISSTACATLTLSTVGFVHGEVL